MKRSACWLFATCLLMAPSAGATCDSPALATLASRFEPDREYRPELTACKAWPGRPGLTIFAIPYGDGGPWDEQYFDLHLVVADTKTQAVRSHGHFPKALVSDALTLHEVVIDTARYRLSASELAFGVVMSRRGSRSSTRSLALFLPQENRIGQVSEWISMGFHATDPAAGDCAAASRSAARTLRMLPTRSQGRFDIAVDEVLTDQGLAADCSEGEVTETRIGYTVKFDGTMYDVPDELGSW
ncbi:hypothetical protein [Tahibacter amnicola]|uniref:Secreted protein n=1 Tax=Tahibacter amnicola TaxID=2976241 RepID=A0ABY6BKF8_9GAMM|nr:hypothetical protein [Tahibacter amnicola]UXI70350.1 hypothetical protein N4264_12165 [Tahibacter amnicola]